MAKEDNAYLLRTEPDVYAAIKLLLAARAVGISGLDGLEKQLELELSWGGTEDTRLIEKMRKTGIHEIQVEEVSVTNIDWLVVGKRAAGWPFSYPVPRQGEKVFSMYMERIEDIEHEPTDEWKRLKLQSYGTILWNWIDRMGDAEAGNMYKELLRCGDADINHHLAIGPGWEINQISLKPNVKKVEKNVNWCTVWMSDVLACALWGGKILEDLE